MPESMEIGNLKKTKSSTHFFDGPMFLDSRTCGSGPLRCMAVTSLNLLPTFLFVYNFHVSNIPTHLTPLIFKYKIKMLVTNLDS